VGSSSSRRSVSCTSVCARKTRCISPPLSDRTERDSKPSRSTCASTARTRSRSDARYVSSQPRWGARPSSTNSSTVKSNVSDRAWRTKASMRARSGALIISTGVPCSPISPSKGRCPPMARRSVVFPAPFGPSTPTQRPAGTSKLTSCRIVCPSSVTVSRSTERNDKACRDTRAQYCVCF